MMKNKPKEITVCNLEVLVMPNGEILCLGKSIGYVSEFGKFLTQKFGFKAALEDMKSITRVIKHKSNKRYKL